MSYDENALVLFSGGQDSATCLAWALSRFQRVETISFDYGQRHGVELACQADVRTAFRGLSTTWDQRLGQDHRTDLNVLGALSDTALTRDVAIKMTKAGLPSTFVPGRNLVFLTFAAIVAARRDVRHIITGVCETDFSGYPDCRDDTIKAFQVALNLGMQQRFVLHTPLMWLDKAQTWRMAEEIGGKTLVSVINEATHSCYIGERAERHAWGYGCGKCPACELRAKGWEAYVGL